MTDGWNMYPRLHMLEREFSTAKKNDADWAEKKDSLGFSKYTREQANAILNNDFLLIAVGYVTKLDLTDWFYMWGLRLSDEAKSQVASAGYKKMPTLMYLPKEANGYCKTLEHPSQLIKPGMAIPAGSQ